jgi:DNA-binding MarR family transcriptional regulator
VAETKASGELPEIVGAYYNWVSQSRSGEEVLRTHGIEPYFQGVAEARRIIRKVLRIVDEQAKSAGLDPLDHQALIQIFAAPSPLRVIDVADRLDIAPAFASRLIKRLEEMGLVTRSPSEDDKRSTYVRATEQSRDLLASIDARVSREIEYFRQHLSEAERGAALGIFAFYVGANSVEDLEHLIAQIGATVKERS